MKEIIDATIAKPVPLDKFYNSNPTTVRIKENFRIRCAKCHSPFVTIGVGTEQLECEESPVFFATINCLACGIEVRTVSLVLEKGNWRMAYEQKTA